MTTTTPSKSEIIAALAEPEAMRMRARLEVGTNGDNAKSAPVRVVANTGTVVEHWYFGPQVHDFAGMRVKGKIPLDWGHDPDNSIGYLSKFDTSTGELIRSGAIVPFGADRGAEVLHKLREGVPFEASIEWRANADGMELLELGQTALVNGRLVEGPVLIWRQWDYVACAVCKFGVDSNTSTELAKRINRKKELSEGLRNRGDMKMTIETQTVEAAAEAQQPEQAVATETPAVEASGKEAEVEASAVEAVEATSAEDADANVEEEVLVASKPAAVEAPDPRAEFKQFLATFGAKAADYFAEGMTFDAALKTHVAHQATQIEQLTQRLAAKADRGLDAPVKFTDAEQREKPKGLAAFIRAPGSKNK